MRAAFIVLACVPLAFTSCAVTKNPLSDRKEAKLDSRLIGVWLGKDIAGGDRYYHVGRVGGKLPEGMIKLIGATSDPNKGLEKDESTLFFFSTTIKGSTYLNLASAKNDQFLELKENGWKPTMIGGYNIFKYTLDKDVLKIRPMDLVAVTQAVRDGKIKGTIAKHTPDEPNVNPVANVIGDALDEPVRVMVTDTSENLRRVIGSDDAFFVKEGEPLTMVLKRVKDDVRKSFQTNSGSATQAKRTGAKSSMKQFLKKLGRFLLWVLPALLAIYVTAKLADYCWYRLQIPIGFHDANWTGQWDTEQYAGTTGRLLVRMPDPLPEDKDFKAEALVYYPIYCPWKTGSFVKMDFVGHFSPENPATAGKSTNRIPGGGAAR